MTEREFRESIQSGLGRAILYACANDVERFRDVILDACLHCYSVDPQWEGTRAPYMWELVQLTKDPEFYRAEILSSLENCGDDWDAVQRFRLASYMAMEGDEHAKAAMYRNFNPGPRMVEDTATDFVRMDGIDGLLFAVEREGVLLSTNPADVDAGYLLSYAVETLGEAQVLEALRSAAATNENIAAWFSRAESTKAISGMRRSRSREVQRLRYAQLKTRLSELSSYQLSVWGKEASPDDVKLAALDLQHAQTRDEQLIYLRIFGRRPFPLDHSPLIQMAELNDEQIAVAAAGALVHVEHPDVRELALRLLASGAPARVEAIAMLDRNWKAGDHRTVVEWFRREEDRQIRHAFSIDIRNIWEQHPDPDTESEMLLALYAHGPCSFCRDVVVSRLIELDKLPGTLREECAYDASDDIRLLFR